MGPHGLVIGATGSGKSELLRTLVLGLALTHSSETLNFVLVDFKGGATFASLDVLPHTSAIITNLEDELILVDRMKDAIQGEMVRRQEALRAAGNYASLRDYERAREQGAALEPMPSLFIVVDEFSELLSAKPDFIDLFVMIGRLGRSLGVHLLLASQRLEEGKLRGLDTHLSYRVGLRTFSAMESRVVLGVPDAYELPSAPGNGYLKEGTEGLVRFKAAYVSGAYTTLGARPASTGRARAAQVLPYQIGYLAPREELAPADPRAGRGRRPTGPRRSSWTSSSTGSQGAGTPARKVWLPPLDTPPTLDELLPPLKETELGLRPVDWDTAPALAAPIGLIDRPFDQRRDPHWVNLASSHFVVVGRPQSGKSTVLRTLIAGMALTHTPEQVQFYCLDFGGGTLTGLADLPHVGSVATRLEPERLRRTVAEINVMLAEREQLFTQHRIDSMASYRRLAAAGTVPRDGFGDVFLVVDGWGTVRADHEALEAAITQIAARGLGYGVHVVLSIQRWMEMRPALRDLISNRLELRLGDPSESEFDRRIAADVPEGKPGPRHQPRTSCTSCRRCRASTAPSRSTTSSTASASSSPASRDAWSGPRAPPVRLLPRELPYARPAGDRPDRGAHCRSASTRTRSRRCSSTSTPSRTSSSSASRVGEVEPAAHHRARHHDALDAGRGEGHHLRLPPRPARRGRARAPDRLRDELRRRARRRGQHRRRAARAAGRHPGRPQRRRGAEVDRPAAVPAARRLRHDRVEPGQPDALAGRVPAPGARHRPARDPQPLVRRRRAGHVRAGHAQPARHGHAGHPAVRQQGRGRGARLGEDGAAAHRAGAGWCTAGSVRCWCRRRAPERRRRQRAARRVPPASVASASTATNPP